MRTLINLDTTALLQYLASRLSNQSHNEVEILGQEVRFSRVNSFVEVEMGNFSIV